MICDLQPVKNYYKVNVKGGNQTPCNIYTQTAGNPVVIKQQYAWPFKGQSSLSPFELTISISRVSQKKTVFDKGQQTGTIRYSSLEITTQYFRSKRLNDINIFS